MARRSTDAPRVVSERPLVPKALHVGYVPNALCATLSEQFGVSGAPSIVKGALTDSARIARGLAAASGAALAVLEAVAGAGGQIPERQLVELLTKRFGWERERTIGAVREAAARGLLLFLGAKLANRGASDWYVILVAEVATQIAEATLGISLPAPPNAAAPRPTSLHRDRVARLAACAHFAVKSTRGGNGANRATLRKLAAAVGASEVLLHGEIEHALSLGVLTPEGELIVPHEPVLRAFAAGQIAWDIDHTRSVVRSWIPDDRWISEEAVVRAAALQAQARFDGPIWNTPYAFHRTGVLELEDARRVVRECDDLARLEHEGHVFLRRVAQTAHGGGDGHVTPNMEVMLDPDASPDLTLSIALAAEPVRFDRVLTFKLTPASVAVASAHGADAPRLLAALGRVGRHGVPDNVRAMVEDWMRGARTARVRAVWSVELSTSEAADAAARALGKHVVARPTPLLLLVDSALAAPQLTLAKAGVKVAVTSAHGEERSVPVERPVPPPSCALAVALSPPAELVASFEKARRAGFPVEMEPAAPATPAKVRGAKAEHSVEVSYEDDDLLDSPGSPGEILYARAELERSPFLSAMLELAAGLVEAADDALLRWIDRRPHDEQVLALAVGCESPLRLAPLAALAPRWRAKLLRDERTIEGLIRASERIFDTAHTSELGGRLLVALAAPTANALWQSDRAVVVEASPKSVPTAADASLQAKPRARDLARQPSDEVRRLLDVSIATQNPIWALVSSKSQGERVTSLRVERVLERGTSVVVLATDLEADEGRSFPLSNVVAVRPQATPPSPAR